MSGLPKETQDEVALVIDPTQALQDSKEAPVTEPLSVSTEPPHVDTTEPATEVAPKTEVVVSEPSDIVLDEQQLQAVVLCTDVTKRIVGVTGPAGTGKTTILRHVARVLRDAGYRVCAAAPTGKAARRIREATGLESMTIHKLLEYPYPGERNEKTGEALRQGVPKRDRHNPLEWDVVLADEYAMVNHELHANLIDALPRGGMLRAFGDVNQLPPIEKVAALQSESPYQQILARWPSVKLTQIHRQGDGSGIVIAGANILKGKAPVRSADFIIDMTDDPVRVLTRRVREALEKGEHFGTLEYQVISPTKKSWVGTVKINATMQQILNPKMPHSILLPRHTWAPDQQTRLAIGDKIVWTQNNYDLEIMNGETGIVTQITEHEEIVIDFGDRIKPIPPQMAVVNKKGENIYVDPRKDIDLAYCLTTHKSQGSEFIHVIYVLNKSSSFMQDRSNFYTAITRASKRVTLIADQRSFFASLQQSKTREKKGLDE